MNAELSSYLLQDVSYTPSSNCDDYPNIDDIDLLVIHCISLPPGNYAGDHVEKLFTNQLAVNDHPYYETILPLKVSAHIFIRRDGRVIQFVPFNKRAWHAGVSSYAGKVQCNDYSIGIELEGIETDGFTEKQYEALSKSTKELFKFFPKMKKQRIVAHSDIAPDRKKDPGSKFDWQKYFALLD